MPELRIGSRLIGDGHPSYVIAEIGVNHNGILEYAYRLIDASIAAGADAVKFQKRDLRQLFPEKYLENPNVGEKNLNYLLPILQEVELSEEDFRKLAQYSEKRGITFLCSAFEEKSVEFVDSLGVPAFKVASADMTNLPLLEKLTTMGKPLIVSTGMSRWDEVVTTVEFLQEREAEFALLHCNSTYPAAFEDIVVVVMCAVSACFGFWGSRIAYRSFRWRLGFEDGITCARCGYNLTGLTEPRCPECGQPFEAKGDAP